MKNIWDFDEEKNYTSIGGYKVIQCEGAKNSSELLKKIHNLINKLMAKIYKIITINKIDDKYINLLLKTPYKLQEMQLKNDQGDIIFEGLNKPKNIKINKTNDHIGEDGKKRASHRLIFLNIKHDNGRLKSLNNLKPLIAHELTHTAMNHVTWKDDNHSDLFIKYNNMILKVLNDIK